MVSEAMAVAEMVDNREKRVRREDRMMTRRRWAACMLDDAVGDGGCGGWHVACDADSTVP